MVFKGWQQQVVELERFRKFKVTRYIRPVLFLLSGIWKIGNRLHRELYSSGLFKVHRLPVPVISIGNVAAGGSGKTPMVEFIANSLSFRKILIMSRGFGNDEYRQLKANLPYVDHFIGANRGKLGKELFSKHPFKYETVLLDDALQHYSLHRDIEITMVNCVHGMSGAYNELLPLGNLRESWSEGLARSDIVVLHHANLVSKPCLQHLYSKVRMFASQACTIVASMLIPFSLVSLNEHHEVQNTSHSVDFPCNIKRIHGFCGLGCPEAFEMVVSNLYASTRPCKFDIFPDHHKFTSADISLITRHDDQFTAYITSEKDFHRCPFLLQQMPSKGARVFYLRTKLKILPHNYVFAH